jgi:signal peptidase II
VLDEWLLSTALILALDQASKRFVVARQQSGAPIPAGQARWVARVDHRRLAFGLCDRRALLLLWCVAVIGTSLLISHVAAFQGRAAQIGLGAAIGGATGNLLDMLLRGAVVDFIDLRIWPLFNLADAAIVGGVVVALWSPVWTAL